MLDNQVTKQVISVISDREEFVREFGRFMFSRFFHVQVFSDRETFFRIFSGSPSDVVVLFIQTYDKSLVGILQFIKEIDEDTRIIIITDTPSERLEALVRRAGIAYFALWPEDRHYLKDIITAALVSRSRETLSEVRDMSRAMNQRVCI